MSKLYKAVDKQDGTMSCFLVNDRGVAVSDHCGNDMKEVASCKRCEDIFSYSTLGRFNDAIDPVLIAEW